MPLGVAAISTAVSKADYEALAAFRYGMRRFLRFSESRARKAGLTPQQHQMLLSVKGMPGREWATLTEIAERLQVRHNAAVGLVDRAERAGLVERRQDLGDRRQVRVYVTPAGESVLAELTAAHREELGRLAAELGMTNAFALRKG